MGFFSLLCCPAEGFPLARWAHFALADTQDEAGGALSTDGAVAVPVHLQGVGPDGLAGPFQPKQF